MDAEEDTGVEGRAYDGSLRAGRGEPLLVWGEYGDDALRVRTPGALAVTLDGLHDASFERPCLVRLWATADEQVIAVMSGDETALYLVHGHDGAYGGSVGAATTRDAFELTDHDAGALAIPWADCIAWRVARPALLRFAEQGELGPEVSLENSIPGPLLWLGEIDRAAELETRPPPPGDPALSSLPRLMPCGRWAERLLTKMIELGLIEADLSMATGITASLAMLLQQMGEEAEDSADEAHRLAREISRLRGVGALFATGGDLQVALRRTREPATQPVDMRVVTLPD